MYDVYSGERLSTLNIEKEALTLTASITANESRQEVKPSDQTFAENNAKLRTNVDGPVAVDCTRNFIVVGE